MSSMGNVIEDNRLQSVCMCAEMLFYLRGSDRILLGGEIKVQT